MLSYNERFFRYESADEMAKQNMMNNANARETKGYSAPTNSGPVLFVTDHITNP